MSARISCINPRCRRTAPADKYEEGEEIICRGCWKLLPKHLTDRYKTLNRREKRTLSRVERRIAKGTITLDRVTALSRLFERKRLENWLAIRSYFREDARPVGIEHFLEEIGLSE